MSPSKWDKNESTLKLFYKVFRGTSFIPLFQLYIVLINIFSILFEKNIMYQSQD